MRKRRNYLDYIPVHNPLHEYGLNSRKNIEIRVHNTGLFSRIAQIVFKRPEYSNIELDSFGSFVWSCIDGKRSVYEIGLSVREHFGDRAEPLYERLCTFLKNLQEHSLIVMRSKSSPEFFMK